MKFGVPDFAPKSVVQIGYLAECEGWTVIPSYVTVPERNITLRFRKMAQPAIWAAWRGERYGFWRAYAQTAQRLSFADLKAVLVDPTLLEITDPEWPFGKPEETAGKESNCVSSLGH